MFWNPNSLASSNLAAAAHNVLVNFIRFSFRFAFLYHTSIISPNKDRCHC